MSNDPHIETLLSDLTKDKGREVASDAEFNALTPKEDHDNAYTAILDAYVDNLKKTMERKRTFKTWFFAISCFLLVSVFWALVYTIWLSSKKPATDILEWCSAVLPALGSFLTVFIVIPKIIAEYLFNLEEEKYMSEIIKNIQDYDKGG